MRHRGEGKGTVERTDKEAAAAVEPEGTVRFEPPAGWSCRRELHEGHPVLVFEPADATGSAGSPACPPVVLRLVADRVADDGQQAAQVRVRELALRFVRPDDPRASDRVIEGTAGGDVAAQAVMRTEENGRREVHYLWFIGGLRNGGVAAAMFSALVPDDRDGEAATATLLEAVDTAIRNASLRGKPPP